MKKMKVLMSVFLFFIFAAGITFSQEMKPEAGKLYNEGNKMLKAGNYDGALKQYNQALVIEKDYRTYYQRGIALKGLGNLKEAQGSFESCISMKPDFEGGYNALGGIYYTLGKYDSAVTNFEKVINITKNNSVKEMVSKNLSRAYSKLGEEAEGDGKSKKAEEYLTKAVGFSNYDAAYLSLAKLYTEIGEWDKAIASGEKALKYRSSIGTGGPYYYMGLAYKNKSDVTKAKEMFEKAKHDKRYAKNAQYELTSLK